MRCKVFQLCEFYAKLCFCDEIAIIIIVFREPIYSIDVATIDLLHFLNSCILVSEFVSRFKQLCLTRRQVSSCKEEHKNDFAVLNGTPTRELCPTGEVL